MLVPMAKVEIIGPKSQFLDVVSALHDQGKIHIEDLSKKIQSGEIALDRMEIQGDEVRVYDQLDELLGTKLRALYQRKKGRDLFDLFIANLIDAVILDYQMPGVGGDVIATRMKRTKPYVPIILLSSFGPLPGHKLTSIDVFLTKSQEAKALLPCLQVLLSRRPKAFFHRWFDHWRGRNHAIRP